MGIAAKNSIPLHRLGEVTDRGFQVDRIVAGNDEARDAILLGTHRDDHYIFFVQETGYSKGMVDFSFFTLEEMSTLYILPGQVHCYLESNDLATGWFLALDTGLVPDMFRAVLEDPSLIKQPLPLGKTDFESMAQCLELLYTVNKKENASPVYKQACYGLINSFTAMQAALYTGKADGAGGHAPRPVIITREFRKLLLHRYKTCKSPVEYASSLNISLSYLNEAVKATTGFPVSNMIQQEIMLEAKRLLYHSACSVKEIAHELGYEDHTYFSRLFKKTVGVTPGEFRQHYRE